MDKKTALIKKLKIFRKETTKELKLQRMIFFGSRAVGKPKKHSDIDLIMVSANFHNLTFRQRATKMYDYWHLDYPVDFLCYTPAEFKKLRSQATIVRDAVRQGIEI